MFRVLTSLIFVVSFAWAGAAFESDSYLIWIGSNCPTGSTTCKQVTYNHTHKSNGEKLVIQGGEPLVGNISGGLTGYKFIDRKAQRSLEISISLSGEHTLYIRSLKPPGPGSNSFIQEGLKPLDEATYQKKLRKLKK